MEILIIIGLVLLNGIFSMAEMSLVSSRKFRLESSSKKGNKGAQAALRLSENPNRFLSTVQIGITLIGILLGVYSGENMTDDVTGFLSRFEWLRPYADTVAVFIIVVFVTYLSIVLGELLPKRLGLTFPEPIAIVLAQPMLLLSKITAPFVWLLTKTSEILLRLMGIRSNMDSKVSEEEIKSIIKESAEGGEIQDIEQNIVEN
jgi:putative hemolysin